MALIKPTVYSDLVREKVTGKVKILQLARELENLDEFKEVGETVTFPKWKYIGDAAELALKGKITPVEMEQTSTTATVTHIAKGVKVFDRENKTAIGDQLEEGADQLATSIARKLDTDLLAELNTNVLLKSPTVADKAITEDELIAALGLFGDDQDRENFSEGGIVINSLLMAGFYKMASFVSTQNTLSADGNGIIKNGLFGYFLGIPVYVADKGTLDGLECVTYILQNNAIGYKTKKNIDIEEQRVADEKATGIFADMMYAVKLLDDSKAVIVRKTIV